MLNCGPRQLEHTQGGFRNLVCPPRRPPYPWAHRPTSPCLPAPQWVGFGLSLLPFAGMLLVLSAERDERNVAGVRF